MDITLPSQAIAGYVRLSRAELNEQGSFEEKVERHKRILLRLAEAHGIPLSLEQIVVEIKSGEKLATRPGLLSLLERARCGQLRVLVVMAVDRLTRSVVDQAPIAEAFFAGEVLLVSQDGKTLFDQHLDTTPWQLKALIAEWERDRYSFRRKVHNEERAAQGQRSCGYAPYGYRWIKPKLSEDGRAIVEPGHYRIIEAEYAVVEEIFRRIYYEGIPSILQDLNQRFLSTGFPAPPSHGRRDEDRASAWSSSTLHKIITNPLYCGHPAHRTAMLRGKGRTQLAPSDWIFAKVEQDYPHPLQGLDAWYELQDILYHRRPNYGGNATEGILTRLLKCPQGKPMHSGGSGQYTCTCKAAGTPHPSSYITAWRIETIALTVLQEAFAALPIDALPTAALGLDRKSISKQRAAAMQEQAAQEHLATELMKNATLIISLYGEADFRDKAEANKRALDAARERVQEMDALLAQPDLAEKKALLQRIASLGEGDIRLGTKLLWEAASFSKQREMLRYVILELRLRPAAAWHKHCREVEVTLTPFYASYYSPPVFDVMALCPHYLTLRKLSGETRNAHPCTFCGKTVLRLPCKDKTKNVFCNMDCYNAWRSKQAQGPQKETFTCGQCQRPFQRKPSVAKHSQIQFCGRECYKAWKAGQPLNIRKQHG